ncbi:MAG: trimethylamine methyltransferase [Spirochaetes bacterium]|nr:trimethylamine methyltransferase [Spirochaetota bacterium]
MTNFNELIGKENRILSEKQVEQVSEYAFRLLEEEGSKIRCKEALDILEKAGCNVKDPDRVKIPRKLVMEAVKSSARDIEVYNRDGRLSMIFKEYASYYGTGSDCSTTIDLYSGERKICKKRDVEKLAQFCDTLPNIDFIMSFGIANDAPDGGNFVHQYEAMLLNTNKPVIVTAHGRNDMKTIIDMAAAAAGGLDKVKSKPSLILYTEPVSPMVHTEMGVGKALVCCEYDIPFIYIASPMMGATAPATLEAALVQTVAESLAGLVVFQNKKPGSKFIFGGDATILDMSTSIFSYGSPELNVLNACLSDMAHYYNLPFFCIAGASDSKVLDAQAGLEYGMSIYNAALNKANIIHDCGYLEYGSTSSFESILFADEIISMVKYMIKPLNFNDETVPIGLMDRVGPGNDFLMEEHTFKNFKKTFWFPRYLDRKGHDAWQKAGSNDLLSALNKKAREIFEKSRPNRLPDEKVKKIKDIVSKHIPDMT